MDQENHGLDSNISVLRRWASHSERPLPTNWYAFRQAHTDEALAVEAADPLLVSLLNRTASADLRADAIENRIPIKGTTVDEMQDLRDKAELQRLYQRVSGQDKDESGNVIAPTLTERMGLKVLNEQVYAKAESEAALRFGRPVDQQQQEAQRQQDEHRRVQSRNHYGSRY